MWCASARRLLGWMTGPNPMRLFMQQVVDHDRGILEEEWQSLTPGVPIDRVIDVRIGGELCHVRFVAGRSDEGIRSRIVGFFQVVNMAGEVTG
jgi:hypothetical protein